MIFTYAFETAKLGGDRTVPRRPPVGQRAGKHGCYEVYWGRGGLPAGEDARED